MEKRPRGCVRWVNGVDAKCRLLWADLAILHEDRIGLEVFFATALLNLGLKNLQLLLSCLHSVLKHFNNR